MRLGVSRGRQLIESMRGQRLYAVAYCMLGSESTSIQEMEVRSDLFVAAG